MSGIYSLSRNPVYLGRMIEWVGFALVIANDFVYGQSIVVEPYALFYLAHLGILVNSIVMHHWCIRAEEKFLSARHGLNYVRYTQTVPRYVSLPALARQLTDSLTTST
jgi:protein-S-isoprenylcysteine O-methyltransferase Ste14